MGTPLGRVYLNCPNPPSCVNWLLNGYARLRRSNCSEGVEPNLVATHGMQTRTPNSKLECSITLDSESSAIRRFIVLDILEARVMVGMLNTLQR